MRDRVEFHDLELLIDELATTFEVTDILVEDRASGVQLIQEIQRKGKWSVAACQPVGDKAMRLRGQTPMMRAGFVYLPADAPWLDEYLRELTAFPNTRFADQVDSTSQFLAWVRETPSSFDSIMGFYRDSMDKDERKRQAKEEPTVRLLVPPGITQIRTLSGLDITVANDGIIAVCEDDAKPLALCGWLRVE